MKHISAWAIRNPIAPLVLFVVLTFLGIVAFIRLPINLNPGHLLPADPGAHRQPGAAPPEIETQIVTKVEGAVANLGNLKNITSVAFDSTALLHAGVPHRHAARSRA